MSLTCKSCGTSKYLKNGFLDSVQRYKCMECRVNFVSGDKRQKYTIIDRLKVITLYLENCGIRTIEHLTGIRNSQISKWIEDTAGVVRGELIKSQNSVCSSKI